MNSQKSFLKMQGTGNNFILIQNNGRNQEQLCSLTKKLCDNCFGIGADGALIIYPPNTYTINQSSQLNSYYHMKIINKDGSYAQMCGNGLRCFSALIHKMGFEKNNKFDVSTDSDIKTVEVETISDREFIVSIKMGSYIHQNIKDISISVSDIIDQFKGKLNYAHYILFNVPHIIISLQNQFSKSLDDEKLKIYGKYMQKNYNANINFMHSQSDNSMVVRTYERGAGLTLACGTGVCASYISATSKCIVSTSNSINFITKGGIITLTNDSDNVIMKASAKIICSGEFYV